MKNLKPKKFKPISIDEITYPVLYNGRRLLILDSTNDPELGLNHAIVIWDKRMNWAIGWADQNSDGSYEGVTIYGPHDIPFSGANLRELAANCFAEHMWAMRH